MSPEQGLSAARQLFQASGAVTGSEFVQNLLNNPTNCRSFLKNVNIRREVQFATTETKNAIDKVKDGDIKVCSQNSPILSRGQVVFTLASMN